MAQKDGVVDVGRVVAWVTFVTYQKTACRALEEPRGAAMHKPGQVHRLGKFRSALQSAQYERLAGTAVVLHAAFGEIDSQSAVAAERT